MSRGAHFDQRREAAGGDAARAHDADLPRIDQLQQRDGRLRMAAQRHADLHVPPELAQAADRVVEGCGDAERIQRDMRTAGPPPMQSGHWPQARMNGAVTRSPRLKRRQSRPTSSMTPANSWPGTWGAATSGSAPVQACQSDRQTPQAFTLPMAPSGGQGGSSTLRTTSGW